MRLRRIVSPVLLLGGATLVAVAVLRGSASASLLVIFPLFTGSSLVFLLGVLCLVIGFVTLPLTLWDGGGIPPEEAPHEEPDGTGGPGDEPPDGFGGVVVIGPVPVFVGRWRNASKRVRWAVALVGLALLGFTFYLAFPFRW